MILLNQLLFRDFLNQAKYQNIQLLIQLIIKMKLILIFMPSTSSLNYLMMKIKLLFLKLLSISNIEDLESSKAAVGTPYNLSHHKQGLLAIFKSDGIPALLVSSSKCNKPATVEAGGVQAFAMHLDNPSQRLRNVLLHRLQNNISPFGASPLVEEKEAIFRDLVSIGTLLMDSASDASSIKCVNTFPETSAA
ncbi:hypothetical protein TKK_0013252 [Trichogramma kaykai]